MGMFKTGALIAGGACALAMIAGHGSVPLGFSRMGSDVKATWRAFGGGEVGLSHSDQASLDRSEKRGSQLLARSGEEIQASARTAAALWQSKAGSMLATAKSARPVDSAVASLEMQRARRSQRELGEELFANALPQADERAGPGLAGLLANTSGAPSLEDAKVQSLRELAASALELSPLLRSAVVEGVNAEALGKHGRGANAAPTPSGDAASRAGAFCDAFAAALTAMASPEQAQRWGLPTDQALMAAGLPGAVEARLRWSLPADDADPIATALDRAAKEALAHGAKWAGQPMGKEIAAEGWLRRRALPPAGASALASAAVGALGAGEGAVARFTAKQLGADPQALQKVAAKIAAKRAKQDEAQTRSSDEGFSPPM